ncbi:ead/Ea22-like family protein [Enterobacter hormaechei]|uniref:ead/Ea22-like family protein n=1 Tax=Enterobacter hormaechei TaxID=158836 RepID=UPI0013D4E413|nr:ead/Ea22-like family protein [Enterobacter hormaechei]
MSNFDKRALREAAEKATPGPWYVHDKPCEDGNYGIDTSDKEFLAEAVVWWGFARQSIWREEDAKHIAAANPATVLALLDELEAKDKQIAELSRHLQCAHGFIEHTEAFGHEASNGILCCGDAQWNIDESKSALAAAGKGE